MQELIPVVISSAGLILSAFTAFIVSYFKSRSIKTELKNLKEALSDSNKNFYVICPNCGHKIILRHVDIKSED